MAGWAKQINKVSEQREEGQMGWKEWQPKEYLPRLNVSNEKMTISPEQSTVPWWEEGKCLESERRCESWLAFHLNALYWTLHITVHWEAGHIHRERSIPWLPSDLTTSETQHPNVIRPSNDCSRWEWMYDEKRKPITFKSPASRRTGGLQPLLDEINRLVHPQYI